MNHFDYPALAVASAFFLLGDCLLLAGPNDNNNNQVPAMPAEAAASSAPAPAPQRQEMQVEAPPALPVVPVQDRIEQPMLPLADLPPPPDPPGSAFLVAEELLGLSLVPPLDRSAE
jgi:hypothetical protein